MDKLTEDIASKLRFVLQKAVVGNSDHAETPNPASAILIPNDISVNGLGSDVSMTPPSSQSVRGGRNAVTAEAVCWITDAAGNKLDASIQDEGRHFRLYMTTTLIVGLTVLLALSHYID